MQTLPYVSVFVLVLGLGACRLREGEHCVCADECRGGLSCVTTQGALRPGTCATDPAQGVSDVHSGICADRGEQVGGELPEQRPAVPGDMSKRDLPAVGDLEATAATMDLTGTDDTIGTGGEESGTATAQESSGSGVTLETTASSDASSSSGSDVSDGSAATDSESSVTGTMTEAATASEETSGST